jgi:hypothetical protein
MDRLERRYKPKGILTARVMQALSLDKWASTYADHVVEALKVQKALPNVAKFSGFGAPLELPTFAENPALWAEMEKFVWEHSFNGFLEIFKRKYKNAEKILRVRKQINGFTALPEIIHEERGTHARKFRHVVAELLKRGETPEHNLIAEIKRINQKHRTIEKIGKTTPAKLAALDIVVAASIYADLKKAQVKDWKNEAEAEEYWSTAYSEAMEMTFPHVAKDRALIRQILSFPKMARLRSTSNQLQFNLAQDSKTN